MQHRALAQQPPQAQPRILVAGIGNIFLADDGFGSEVMARLLEASPGAGTPGVRLVDYGIRGLHLALDLLDGVDILILVDALPAGSPGGTGRPGSIAVLAIGPDDVEKAPLPSGSALDPHGMDPLTVLKRLRTMGGTLPRTYLVGCTAASIGDGIGLSREVAAAIPDAVAAVANLLAAASRPTRDPAANYPKTQS